MEALRIAQEEYLWAAGNEIFRQLAENPGIEIALLHDLTDFLGAFEGKALTCNDI